MLQERSLVKIIDNSGALSVMLFSVRGKNGRRFAKTGSVVRGSVKKASPGGKVKKGEVVSVLITSTRFKIQRKDGSSIKFSHNCGVIVNKATSEPIATRVFAPVSREIREMGYNKVVSMSPEVL